MRKKMQMQQIPSPNKRRRYKFLMEGVQIVYVVSKKKKVYRLKQFYYFTIEYFNKKFNAKKQFFLKK